MWGLVLRFLVGVGLSFVAALLGPKLEPLKAAEFDDIDVPQSREGVEFGKVYGTVWIKAPQIHWWGDYVSRPVRQRTGKK